MKPFGNSIQDVGGDKVISPPPLFFLSTGVLGVEKKGLLADGVNPRHRCSCFPHELQLHASSCSGFLRPGIRRARQPNTKGWANARVCVYQLDQVRDVAGRDHRTSARSRYAGEQPSLTATTWTPPLPWYLKRNISDDLGTAEKNPKQLQPQPWAQISSIPHTFSPLSS